ncbi:MAG: lactate racemase domain-containing protein, partial [Firmicutes bacterium]|nr:lactate racemase domain-containing protein [Bacillota bacterium]
MYIKRTEAPMGGPEIREAVEAVLGREDLRGRKVLAILPDTTRTAPVPEFFRAFHQTVKAGGGRLDCLIALGTHPPLSRERLLGHLGLDEREYAEAYADCRLANHVWDDPGALRLIGRLTPDEIAAATEGMMREEVPITVNRQIFEYDLLLVLSPVVPHEVAGFSGGEKYFFPGISGEEIIDFFHWLGAVITIPKIIGVRENPVREVLRLAAALIPIPRLYFHVVMGDDGLRGIFAGPEVAAWQAAADLSA